MKEKQKDIKSFLLLYAALFLYSFGGVFSKKAATFSPLSAHFLFYYGMVLAILILYAVLWQQVLKRLPLTTAFSNKAVTVVLGMAWGASFFSEKITLGMIAGAAIIVVGICVTVTADE